jgi:hypothetical protein
MESPEVADLNINGILPTKKLAMNMHAHCASSIGSDMNVSLAESFK